MKYVTITDPRTGLKSIHGRAGADLDESKIGGPFRGTPRGSYDPTPHLKGPFDDVRPGDFNPSPRGPSMAPDTGGMFPGSPSNPMPSPGAGPSPYTPPSFMWTPPGNKKKKKGISGIF